jgi:multidrug resistance protein MdtO
MVTATYQTPEPALTVYVVFFLNKPDRTTSLILNIALVVVITVTIGLVFLLTRAVIDDALWRVASIAIISFAFLFMASASKLQPVANTLALIIAYALDLLGSAPTAELITRGLLYAWLFVGIPAGASIVINLLLAPAPRRLAEDAIAERLRLAAAMLRAPGEHIRHEFRSLMHEGSAEILKHIKLAGLERTAPKPDLDALQAAARSTTAICLLIDTMDREAVTFPDDLRTTIASTLDEMAGILEAGGYPVDISLDIPDTHESLPPLAAKILDDLRETFAAFAVPGPALPAPHHAGGFFAPDAFTNPLHVQYALKATAAAMICYLLYSLLDWPGIHTCFLTCYIVALGTTGDTVEKLTLRIAGCLLGAVIGIGAIVFVIPHLTSIESLAALIFAGALVAGWVAAGTPRISYAGFQIAFAFFLCVIQGAKPGFDLVVARDRIIGILLGNIVVYLIFTHVFPVSVRNRIDAAIASLLRNMARMTTTASRPARLMLVSEGQATLGAIQQDLIVSSYEPREVRPAVDWIEARHDALHDVEGLIGPLFLEADLDSSHATDTARRLDDQADDISPLPASDHASERMQAAAPAGTNAPDAVAIDLRTTINTRLQSLQGALARTAPDHQAVQHAPA